MRVRKGFFITWRWVMGMRWMLSAVGMGVGVLLVVPSVWAANEQTAEAAQIGIPAGPETPPGSEPVAPAPSAALDADHDGIANAVDPDVDGDGTPNTADTDIDGDGTLNAKDLDVDGDGQLNTADPDVDADQTPNTSDLDVDGDGTLNAQDRDVDGDQILNATDPDVDADGTLNAQDPDVDGDGQVNAADADSDGDGVLNTQDAETGGVVAASGTDTDQPAGEAAQPQTGASQPTREQILQAIEATRQTDPELAAEMENQLKLFESGELDLRAEGAVSHGRPQEGDGVSQLSGGIRNAGAGAGLVGPPVDGQQGEGMPSYMTPELQGQLGSVFDRVGTGELTEQEARAQAEAILREHGIDPQEMGSGREETGDHWQGDRGEGFERAYMERLSPEAREQMEQYFTEHEAGEQPTMDRETFEREFGTYEAPTHEYGAPTHEYEAPIHEYEAPGQPEHEMPPAPEYDYQPPQQP